MALTGYLSADDVAIYLQTNRIGRFGVDIRVGRFPEKQNECVVVFDTGGASPDQYLVLDHPSVQIITQAGKNGYNEAKQKAHDIYQLLNRKQNISINGKSVMYAQAVSTPQSLGQDDNGRWQFTTNYIFKVRRRDEGGLE